MFANVIHSLEKQTVFTFSVKLDSAILLSEQPLHAMLFGFSYGSIQTGLIANLLAFQ